MANSILTTPFYEAPFFGKSSAYVGGRDPLGLQTTSVATYSLLLPGITNVTERVRYWSFYCWLVHLYAEKIRVPDYKKFIQFIRRGEFLLAVAIQTLDKYEPGISGQRKAARAIQDLPLDLSQYADILVKGTLRYWQYESGAFGQYFAGVLMDLGLLFRNDYEIFVCSDPDRHEKLKDNLDVSGKALALAYREAIGPDLELRFLEVLQKGIAGSDDLQAFGEKMTLSAIQPGTTEWSLIRKILIGRDLPGRVSREYGTFFRQNTIRLFLDFRRLEPGCPILDFPFWLEDRKGLDTDGSHSDFAFGWYYYAVNEHWHYANELILKAFLDALITRDFSDMHSFVQEFISGILQLDAASSGQVSVKYWFNFWRERGDLSEEESDNTAQTAALGFFKILDLQESYSNDLDAFIQFGRRLGVERRGDFAHGLRHVGEHTHLPPADFLEWYLVRHILNRHLFVAMDKLATTGVNTQKFKLEEQTLIFINSIGVGYTNPRLKELVRFLKDLNVLDQDYFPTEIAGTFLTSELHQP
ncbi:MAG: hypothetical protein IPN33_23025 [Saprospiraceae bacterium]|nr:hypothetical protein [Saprospiraceae bacterium]